MKRTQNNKGFSLVELIVVVAILATLAGIMAGSVGLVGRTKAKAAAQTVDAMLSRCKMENLSGQECHVSINGSKVSILRADGSVLDEKNVDSSVTLSLTPSSSTFIGFDMKTGAVLGDCTSVSVLNANGQCVYEIQLVTLTGEHTIN